MRTLWLTQIQRVGIRSPTVSDPSLATVSIAELRYIAARPRRFEEAARTDSLEYLAPLTLAPYSEIDISFRFVTMVPGGQWLVILAEISSGSEDRNWLHIWDLHRPDDGEPAAAFDITEPAGSNWGLRPNSLDVQPASHGSGFMVFAISSPMRWRNPQNEAEARSVVASLNPFVADFMHCFKLRPTWHFHPYLALRPSTRGLKIISPPRNGLNF